MRELKKEEGRKEIRKNEERDYPLRNVCARTNFLLRRQEKKKTYDRIEETVKTSVFCVIRATKTFRFVDETSARSQAHILCDVHTRTRTRRPHGVRDYEKMKEKERKREKN